MAQPIAYKEYIQLSRMFKIAEVAFHFLSQCPSEELLLLTIVPTGSDLSCIPPTGVYLSCSFSTPSERPSLSFCEGVVFDTPHRHTL
jgi:hypothetical protein